MIFLIISYAFLRIKMNVGVTILRPFGHFEKVARSGRQQIAPSTATAQNLCVFINQGECRCRHSAAVWPFSIR